MGWRTMEQLRHLKPSSGPSTVLAFLRAQNYRFVTPTPATHARNNARAGNERAQSLTDAFGWSRPFARSLLPEAMFDKLRDGEVVFPSGAEWKSTVRVSSLEGELFLHSAFPTLSPEAVFFGPDTYRFARAIKHNLAAEPRRLRRALDLGCGSGAGGVVVAKHAACGELVMSDINESALLLTRCNAAAAGLSNVTTVNSDLFAHIDGEFDMIVANPPYLNDPLQRTYRHGGGELGSALSIRIARAAKDRLSPGGTLLLYTGSPIVAGEDRLLQAIEQDFSASDFRWSYEEMDPDVFGEELETPAYSHVERIAAVVLTVRKPGVLAC
ncbi:MAG TPA: class I SAM-dependent methyltransferase [Bradyrhizobium sp.]|nr:class I SAM-dependent methyltransferase [Bradyrhizobium sp.]